MNKKTFYEAPEAEILNVRFEENILSVINGVNYSENAGGAGGNDSYNPNIPNF